VVVPTLAALSVTSTGTLEIRSNADITLGALASTGTGTVALSGAVTATLGELTTTATGSIEVRGVLAITFDALGIVPEVAWQPVARPGESYTVTFGTGGVFTTTVSSSVTSTELTEA
jgi:hypothetical protein